MTPVSYLLSVCRALPQYVEALSPEQVELPMSEVVPLAIHVSLAKHVFLASRTRLHILKGHKR